MKKCLSFRHILLYAVCTVEAVVLILLYVFAVNGVLKKLFFGDWGTHLEVVTYPKKIVYVLGRDSELEFDGLAVGTAYGSAFKAKPEYSADDQHVLIDVSDVDLSKPGVYTVQVVVFDWVYAFPIQVIDPEMCALPDSER